MPMTEDLSAFFDTDEFATSATWKGTESVKVIFNNAYADDFEVAGRAPRCSARESDFPGIARGQALVIGGSNYKVITWHADGTGVLDILLEKA